MGWYTTRVVKPVKVFKARPNEWVDTGGIFISPYVLYSYEYVETSNFPMNLNLELQISGGRIRVVPLGNVISSKSMVSFLVMESDENIGSKPSPTSNSWVNVAKLSSTYTNIEIKSCSSSSDFWVTHPNRPFKIFVMPTRLSFINGITKLGYYLNDKGGGRYSLSVKQNIPSYEKILLRKVEVGSWIDYNLGRGMIAVTGKYSTGDLDKPSHNNRPFSCRLLANGSVLEEQTSKIITYPVTVGYTNFRHECYNFNFEGLNPNTEYHLQVFVANDIMIGRVISAIDIIGTFHTDNLKNLDSFSANVVIVYE